MLNKLSITLQFKKQQETYRHMPTSSPSHTPWFHKNWPKPTDQRSADILLEDIKKIWIQQEKDPLVLSHDKVIELIHGIGGNSPYLSDLILKDIEFFDFLLQHGPDEACKTTFAQLHAFSTQESRQATARILRITKQKIALSCAIADIGNLWSLQEITLTLSNLAQATLNLAVNHLLLQLHQSKKITLPHPETPDKNSGFIVLGMGKLGAKELNYSSDIDLIILYDPDLYPDNDELNTIFVRMTRQLVTLMEERDENGYVFRTDLRLRPDPSSSPLAVSLPAAITYYESLGQTWERTAMSKARPIAGDIAAGYAFLEAIRPFIWRRHLDFTVIDDIHAMKNRIDQHKKIGKCNLSQLPPNLADDLALEWLTGQNIKLGHGGIREIEFCPQTMQLVWGGRFPELQDSTTVGGLKKLVEKDLIPSASTQKLINAYELLRKTEHRLQMQNDYQTHSLPDNLEEVKKFSVFMGYDNPEQFARELFPLMHHVRITFDGLFAAPEHKERYVLDMPTHELKEYLNNKGFPDEAATILQSWNGSGPRALRTAKARTILTNVLPQILDAFANERNPLLILQRFDTLLARHRAGIQLLSLFERNPALIKRLSSIIGTSHFIAEYIANNPSALDALLEVNIVKSRFNLQKTIRDYLKNSESYIDALPALHSLVHSEEFRLSVARIENQLGLNKTHILRTAMANTIMKALLDKVTKEHQQKYGIVPDGGICIVVLGKAGSWEMASGSDLDLMLIFDHPTETYESVCTPNAIPAQRSLSTNNYYIRLTQTFITAITNAGTAGPLYEVDMRLRPSGSKGPVAVSLSSFERYHKEEAWTWERMALTRARVIGGSVQLQKRVMAAINHALSTPPHQYSNQAILQDVANMRARLLRDAPPSSPWDIKHLTGGLMEVEFIAQALQLTARDAVVRHPCTRIALRRLANHGYLSPKEAKTLIKADHFWRNTQSLLRIFFGKHPPQDLSNEVTPTIIEVLSRDLLKKSKRHTDNPLQTIQEKAHKIGQQVRKIFIKTVGPLP
ncbi:bifunctional [glutamine synthetase] adenylyltransferase/[glutamine synthetase]-adenylyl-L-tyrosine phosphorylase [Commensalibacter oyaizuii]|uniref:Bifunctional [glutamine synthetase] adenylyltransferase/[glutamine synthetase]-adenylyl-L-tyrosine phosphorylase n=1 Tax=Commensalibacter oyaizuii TaxID=3043873 RepID=A0ABT6Q0S4_9PROT|nr:bifunctional [glutamine synthetase] adenylyltransferase/[glutamine synthetase]-adenylyl-L-tyrosine phosphorylase [Commensalibacter sp. TBRC 16381]MDI2090706.1 bifunctional [glutamine synthetase] adenylyltransferase/[glutamine synthetase]-adenylyl-L-tyrosine phosphorylase [Commensalibacter sp. TBRC 16381]